MILQGQQKVLLQDHQKLILSGLFWYLTHFKDFKKNNDLHNASYHTTMEALCKYFDCYKGKLNGKKRDTKLALKKFNKKYRKRF
ncbi:MAG: hypothetical protein K6E76_04505 [Patescibacteria group bacterium]|nr:hypothetical protein [Patescibacteria group bacterium]